MHKFIIFIIFIIISNCSFADDGIWQAICNFFIPHQEQQLLFKTETQYFNIEVREDSAKLRHLVFLPYYGSQSTWNPQQPNKIYSPSLKTLCVTLAATAQPPKKYLFLGMGAGLMPRFIRRHFPKTQIDIVELDPEVPKIAAKYFGYKPDDKTTIIIADARVYINNCKKHYDVIIVDVYNAKAVPFAVTTQEFFSRLKTCLTPQGVAGVNLANLGNEKFLVSELFTISQVFNNLLIYACPGDSNFIPIFSANKPLQLKTIMARVGKLDQNYKFEFNLANWLNKCLIIENINDHFWEKPHFITDDFSL
jgi:spermidine synthase